MNPRTVLCIRNGVLLERDESSGEERTVDLAPILSQLDTGGFVLDTDTRLVTLTTLGDLAYGGASGVATRLAGQTTTTKKVLTQTGDGTHSAAPAWGTLNQDNVGALENVFTTLGDLIYAGAAGAETRLAGNTTTTKKVLTQTGDGNVSAAPAWGTLGYADVGAAASGHNHDGTYQAVAMSAVGDLVYGGASGAPTRLAGNTSATKKYLSQTGDGENSAAPTWETVAASGGAVTMCKMGAGNNVTPSDLKCVAFTSGGTYEIVAGDVITGATSSKTATVWLVYKTGGTWAGGDAAGWLFISGASGAFQSENLNVGGNNNVATIGGDATTNYATPDFRGSLIVHDYDDTTPEVGWYWGIIDADYAGGGITVNITHMATSATSGTVGYLVAIRRIGDSQQDMDLTTGWGAYQTLTAVTVPGTSGQTDIVSVAFTDGAQMDSLAAGELFQICLIRDTPNDTVVGDAEVVAIEIRET